ncbi:AIPR family protein [Ruminiclostridium cellobioparum]|uniref:AIPR family protein n=1 Tax=Ruminiclostridium cellobioparum TaxID=29355 RepID=UPI000550F841|nr:AIPR family protein [Ruminiclostridium cellobioparum]
MEKFKLKAKAFKKMEDPIDKDNGHIKYVCYVQANSIPMEFDNWMSTNPREQKMTTNVAIKIKESLMENSNFHELNRGILMSVDEKVEWDNKTNDLLISMSDPEKHGNIDGGHTLRAILTAKKNNSLSGDKYVFFEFITGIDSPVELAAARNTSVQVDLKSIAELENSFDAIKKAFKRLPFANRIQYKMNEHYTNDEIEEIDVREVIAILIMFSQEIYAYKTSYGTLSDVQPIQCYSGKEASLKKFLYLNSSDKKTQKTNREKMIINMENIIPDIFNLWDTVETTFASVSSGAGKRYGTRKYSKYNNGEVVGNALFSQKDLTYYIPRGLLYPIVGSFRALVQIDSEGKYYWAKPPQEVWNAIGQKLVSLILDEKVESPDVIAKNGNLWSNLFKEVYIYGYMPK